MNKGLLSDNGCSLVHGTGEGGGNPVTSGLDEQRGRCCFLCRLVASFKKMARLGDPLLLAQFPMDETPTAATTTENRSQNICWLLRVDL